MKQVRLSWKSCESCESCFRFPLVGVLCKRAYEEFRTVRRIKKAIIPIAGYGTRLFPATKAVPKALFPIIAQDGFAKPIIQLIIEEALTAGIEEVCLVAQPHQVEPIADYFSGVVPAAIREKAALAMQADRLAEIGERLHFAIQAEPQGFGHAIYCAKAFADGEPVMILLGDHLYLSETDVSCAKQLVDIYAQIGTSVTSLDICDESELHLNGIVHGHRGARLQTAPTGTDENGHRGARLQTAPTGTAENRLFDLTHIAEKPTIDVARETLRVEGLPPPQYLCNFGIDLLTPLLFDILEHHYRDNIVTHGEIQLRDAMAELIRREGMGGYRVAGRRYDTGNPQELLKTVLAFAVHGPYRDAVRRI